LLFQIETDGRPARYSVVEASGLMAVRQLSAIYLAGVAGFGIAVALAYHPALKVAAADSGSWLARATHDSASGLNAQLIQPAANFVHREIATIRSSGEPRVEIALQPVQKKATARKAVLADLQPHRQPLLPPPDLRPSLIPSEPVFAENHAPPPLNPSPAPASPKTEPPSIAIPELPKLAEVQAELHPLAQPNTAGAPAQLQPGNLPSPSYGEIARVTHHLRESLTREMLANFGLFLYVSKASTGPWAQHMYVFAKQPSGDLKLLHNWAVSTGREKVEADPAGVEAASFTPQGYFELDPKRMYEHHVSGQWRTPMPHAMFFNWINRGYETGLAIHAATDEDVAELGTRASAGCVRLSPGDASILFDLVRSKYKGLVPKLAYDRRTQTTSKDGMLLHDAHGRVEFAEGYKALVFIEDFGGQNVVAALY
jgi:hypothetical protein